MASNRSQVFACLVVLGCLATLAVALPTPQEDDSGDFNQPQIGTSYNDPYVPQSRESEDASNESDGNSGEASVPVIAKRSADEAKDQPKIEPVNKAGLTRPWSQHDTPAQSNNNNNNDKEKRSAEETKDTPRTTASTTTAVPTKDGYLTRPAVPAIADKKDKRETKEPIAPPRLPSNTPTTPSKLNTPSFARPTPAASARPDGPTSGYKKDKRSPAEEATTKLPETKPWQTRPEVTTEQVKTSARPVPLPLIPNRNNN